MSQVKVDKYKENKKNRKEIMAKEKSQSTIRKAVAGVLALILCCWLGYSVYNSIQAPDTTPISINTTALDEFLTEVEQ